MEQFAPSAPPWVIGLAAAVMAVLAVLTAHWIVFRLIGGVGSRTEQRLDRILVRRLKGPSRWLAAALALSSVQPLLGLDEDGQYLWTRVAGLIYPALIGWLAAALLGVFLDTVQVRADITVQDNLRARRRRTRAGILYRVGVFVVLLVTFCLMLMSIPSVRSVGVTLIASAGLAGLAVGAAAQPALKNLIAGVQMAFTEPVRIDDVVIVEGEWGRIEEIRLTFVVVKLWDERRLVVPVSQFLEKSFQNWTRETSQLLGAVIWHVDPATDIQRMRDKLGDIIRDNPRWDRRFWNLQVTETGPDYVQVRALVTASDASTAFDLRCDVREAMLNFLRTEMADAIMRRRVGISLPAAARAEAIDRELQAARR